MSTRERWIVYPLLFLALLLILKMSYQNTMELRCRSIECYSLNVKLLNGQPVPPEGLPVLVPRAAGGNILERPSPDGDQQPAAEDS